MIAGDDSLNDWSALILAAGGSERFGAQKLLADIAGKAVIAWTAEAVCAAGFAETVVVTGADDERVAASLAGLPLVTVHAQHWHEGMAASIRDGVSALRTDSKGLFVFLGDMPLVAAEMCGQLAMLAQASGYAARPKLGDRPGHPVCFLAEAIPDLLALGGDEGAEGLLRRMADRVGYLPTNDIGAVADVDTPADLAMVESAFHSRFTSNNIDNAISRGDLPNPATPTGA